MKIFLGTLLFAMAVHDSFGLEVVTHRPVIPIVEPVIKEYGLECSIKDTNTDISKEKQELIEEFHSMRMKIKQHKGNQDCRKNETLKLLSQKLVEKAEDCIVSSNLDEKKSEIVQEFIKSGCVAIYKINDWEDDHPYNRWMERKKDSC